MGLGSGVGFRVRLVSGAWGLGFRVWGKGFRVKRLGLEVPCNPQGLSAQQSCTYPRQFLVPSPQVHNDLAHGPLGKMCVSIFSVFCNPKSPRKPLQVLPGFFWALVEQKIMFLDTWA